jgi:hypothetical protein
VLLDETHLPLLEKIVTQATAALQSVKFRQFYNEGDGRDLDLAPSGEEMHTLSRSHTFSILSYTLLSYSIRT